KSIADSITFCRPRGTSEGRRNGYQNSSITRPATRNICSTTRLMLRSTPHSSRWISEGHSNSPMPGAWNPSLAAATTDAGVICSPPSLLGSAAAVALDDQVEGPGRADHDADGDQEVRVQPPVERPADQPPRQHAGHEGDHDPEGDAEVRVHPPVDRPADQPPRQHAGNEGADDRPDDVRAAAVSASSH